MSAPTDVFHMPLKTAMACLDCGALFEIGVTVCPACASAAIHPLGAWLDREGK
jgi:hypothetical protein